MAAPVLHVELRGLDAPELASFYPEIFGWERNGDLSIGEYSVMGRSDRVR